MARTLLGGLEHATFTFFVFAARLLLVFVSILLPCCWSVHKFLAPRTHTLLGVLGQATLNFVAVATLLFFFFCECPKFCDLAKQRRKIVGGVSEVGKDNFSNPPWGEETLHVHLDHGMVGSTKFESHHE